MRDLFKNPTLAPDVITDPLALGFENNAAVLTVTPTAADRYMTVAESLATRRHEQLGVAFALSDDGHEHQRGHLRAASAARFWRPRVPPSARGRRGYRAAKSLRDARTDGDTLAQALGVAIEGILQSPYFLYRAEIGSPANGMPYSQLSQWEIASRLSYLLWSSMPDEPLATAARTNQLGSKDAILGQAKRMLGDERARAMVANFNQQWLLTYKLDSIQKDAATYPDFTPSVASAMQTETDMFVDDVVWQSGGSMMDLFTAPYTFRNKALSDFYKASGGATGNRFARVDLDSAGTRGFSPRAE